MFKNFRKRWVKERIEYLEKSESKRCFETIRGLRFSSDLYVVGDTVGIMYYADSDGPTRELEVVDGKIIWIGESSFGCPSYIRLDTSTRFHGKTMDINVHDIHNIALWEVEDAETR